MKIPYTYEIYKLNYSTGHFEVRYIPSDPELTAVTWNVPVMFDADGNLIPVEDTIDFYAPHREWAGQKFLLVNKDNLINATGVITP